DGGQRSELGAILEWLRTTREGSLQDLPFTPTPAVWDEVASETDVCLRARCPHFEQCFYQRARRDAASADVLVVNHHLLFSDLAVRRAQGNYTAPAVLPPYRRVILDEAHNLEESATSHLGAAVSRRGLFRLLGRLERRGRGLLRIIEERLKAGRDDLLQQDALREISGTVRPALERVRQRAADFFRGLDTLVAAAPEGVLRLDAEFLTQPLWAESLSLIYEGLALSLEELARGLERLRETILLDTAWSDALQGELVELQGAAGRTRAALDALRLAFAPAQDAFPLVRWLERRGGREAGAAGAGGDGGEGGERGEGNVAVRTAPVDISEPLRESLFEQVDTAVLTSATLATRGDFGFLKSRLGLARGGLRLREAVYPSPFEFERQTLIAIPTDVPAPVGEEGAFDYATAEIVADVADTSDGGIFGLFTSYRSLRAVAGELRRRGLHARWPLFEQGEAPRAQLIEAFTRCGRGVLLGVASFWEGVDVPGHPLRGLVIAKLPFKVPAEPVTAARIEAIEQEGGDSFREYVLPHAALRLKQGFGRLIRSGSDRGAVVLLDRRVVEKGYGRYFFETLPPAPVHTGPWSELRAVVRQFYGNAPG
ncbi:MAG: helicase, partial [Gemmatimonadetes bacterium]|nr:helicase [Gemmatimonadota bacterium]